MGRKKKRLWPYVARCASQRLHNEWGIQITKHLHYPPREIRDKLLELSGKSHKIYSRGSRPKFCDSCLTKVKELYKDLPPLPSRERKVVKPTGLGPQTRSKSVLSQTDPCPSRDMYIQTELAVIDKRPTRDISIQTESAIIDLGHCASLDAPDNVCLVEHAINLGKFVTMNELDEPTIMASEDTSMSAEWSNMSASPNHNTGENHPMDLIIQYREDHSMGQMDHSVGQMDHSGGQDHEDHSVGQNQMDHSVDQDHKDHCVGQNHEDHCVGQNNEDNTMGLLLTVDDEPCENIGTSFTTATNAISSMSKSSGSGSSFSDFADGQFADEKPPLLDLQGHEQDSLKEVQGGIEPGLFNSMSRAIENIESCNDNLYVSEPVRIEATNNLHRQKDVCQPIVIEPRRLESPGPELIEVKSEPGTRPETGQNILSVPPELESGEACTDEVNHTCPYCNECFSTPDDFHTHLTVHNEHTVVPSADRGRYACYQCSRSFGTPKDLSRHVVTHQCGKSIVISKNLGQHTVEKSYVCSQCGKGFRQSGSLKLHMFTHPGHKPFPCEHCHESFERIRDLKRHAKTHKQHTEGRPYSCPKCNKSYIRPSSLKKHMKIHAGTSPHTCVLCHKSFISAQALKMHMAMAHLKTKLHPTENWKIAC